MKVSVAEAKAQFSEILRRAEAGEEIEVTRYGRPIVRLTPVRRGLKPGFFGAMKGEIWMAPDFGELPPEVQAAFEGPITFDPMEDASGDLGDPSADMER